MNVVFNFAKLLFDRRFVYIATNVLTSGLGFIRNVVFMRLMGQGDLGQIALMQTISMSVSLLQFGLINGGYRIYASGDPMTNRRVNDNVFTSLALLTAVVLAMLLALRQVGSPFGTSIHFETVVFGIAAGLVSLCSTWTNNTLVAEGRLKLSSMINLGAASVSLAVAFLAGEMGLQLALLAVLMQPLVTSLLALIFNPAIRPKPALSKKIMSEILVLGFFPFCAGVLALVNMQIERWFIVFDMGTEPLGRYYIVIMYTAIFSLVPASLLNLFYPKAIQAYEMGDQKAFIAIIRSHLRALLLYIVSLVALTVWLLEWALNAYLLNFTGQQQLVFLALPGLVAMTCFDSAALVLQSTRRMLPIFLFGAIALILNTALLALGIAMGKLNLEFVAIVKSSSYILAGLIIMVPLFIRRKLLFLAIEPK